MRLSRGLVNSVLQKRLTLIAKNRTGAQSFGQGKVIFLVLIFFGILTFPIANNPLSNRSTTPRNRKNMPNPANPTPISEK